jgi:hypothetical protein
VGPRPVWTGAENLLPPTGIRSPDRPARSQSLYRLSYPAHAAQTVYLNMRRMKLIALRLVGLCCFAFARSL